MNSDTGSAASAANTEAELRKLADQRAPILQQLSEGVIIAGVDGQLLFVNEAAERLHGVKKLDVAPDEYSKSYSLFTMDGAPHPFEELPLARAVTRGETIEDARWRIRRPDGSEIVAIGSARPLTTDGRQIGAILNVRDDSERFEAEQRLRDSEERLRLVIDAARDYAIFTTDTERRVTGWSKGAENIFGFSAEQAVGMSSDVLWTSEDRGNGQPAREVETALATGCAEDERWHLRSDGARVFLSGSVHPLPADEEGRQRGVIKIARDETTRHAAARALRESQEQTQLVLDNTASAFYSVDREGNTTLVSRRFLEMIGFSDESEALGRKLHDVIHHTHPDGSHYPVEQCPIYCCASTAKPAHVPEELFFRLDGEPVPVEYWVAPIMRGDEHVGATCTIIDLSQRKEAERAVRESEARFRNMADHAPVMMWVTEPDGYCSYLNRGWYDFTGQTEEEALGFGWLKAVHPDDAAEAERAFVESNANSAPFRVEYRLRRADGVYRWAIDAAAPRFGVEGEFLGFVGSVVDIDERKLIEQALSERSEEFYALADNIPALAWMAYADGAIFWYNRRWYDYTGTDPETQEGWGWETVHDPEVLPIVIERWTASLRNGEPFEMTFPLRRADGQFRPFLTRVVPITDDQGNITRWFGTNTDISEQIAAEEKLRELNETLERRVLEIAADRERAWRVSQELLAVFNADGAFAEVNAVWTTTLGWDTDELLGQPFASFTHPDDLEATLAKFAATFETPLTVPYEYRFRRKDGGYHWFSWTATFEQGRVYASGRDVNAEKEREAELKRAQEALRQSQKMETLGQLTGGIAHDFNNLLQIITGNLDILQRTMPEDSPRQRRSVENAMRGAERAAVLTQRLLAFSRRQPLAPKVIDPNKLVAGMSEMLHRTLGETIAIETVRASGLWRVEADPNQLENAILNLAVNSRDAMPGGGKLTIETANTHLDRDYSERHSGVAAGQYVVICVSDTGAGMDADTAERAFDPFFTTKEVGKGTGLGLSMVYGFVKQSGGHLKIYSEAGDGTTVKIYLPRHHGEEEAVAETVTDDAPPEGAETILVCEDDDDVRAYSVDSLRELGYRVIEAADGEAA
ncbi:MAG: PAS domain S-box protein, partial [Pseudomonadota bacterium]|nr:PAS domain S-box protein [Pseudomonadota bacterium]